MNKISLVNLKNALATLEEGLKFYNSTDEIHTKNMFADSCIQRFEYSYETTWKLMKRYLKVYFNKTEQELTIKNIFRYIQGYGLINDWTNWVVYNDARNNTSHEYDLIKSRKVLDIIPKFYNDACVFLQRMEKTINAD